MLAGFHYPPCPDHSNTLLRCCVIVRLFMLLCREDLPAASVPIVLPAGAPTNEYLAAQDLKAALGRLYPLDQFILATNLPAAGMAMLVGSVSEIQARTHLSNDLPKIPESFTICTQPMGGLNLGIIEGADSRGVANAIYAILEKLGCGFYLSCDTYPPARSEPFSFAGWQLADQPLVGDRIVFEWHNFLSGCSTWNLSDWTRWTDQAQKMRYNAIMVHSYGNNPMVEYEFNGKLKPVSYLTTTIKGNDWGVEHVNDVRRLVGGEVFDRAEFGADAALVPEDQRVKAAQSLMRKVFDNAAQHGMGVNFAYDVDTISANPQDLILTLPEAARFATRFPGSEGNKFWIANPETPEGYRYYKTQVETLLETYPQITCLVVWFRQMETPWMEVKLSEMPEAWQKEYQSEIAKTPGADTLWHSAPIFAIGKIVRAFDRALHELKLDQVQVAAGTWNFNFLTPCDRFFPTHTKLFGLDYNILKGQSQLKDADSRKVIREVAAHREVVPVVWAQHDDGGYIGRPYAPFSDFYSKLTEARATGFGIYGWTTRPLDLYYTSCAKQVWQATPNQVLPNTCDGMAVRWFGADARGIMAKYLERWMTDAPMFGRETSNWFIDPPSPLTNTDQVVAGCLSRLKLIDSVNVARLTPEQLERLDYFKGLEKFIVAFYQAQTIFQESQDLLAQGDLTGARARLAGCHPEAVIEQFARFSSLGGITRGEQGLVVGLNTRWLSHLIGLKQSLGLEPVRLCFGPTEHDKLAQAHFPGIFTFHLDLQHHFWEQRGRKETGAEVYSSPENAADIHLESGSGSLSTNLRLAAESVQEIGATGIESDKLIEFSIHAITAPATSTNIPYALLPAGSYELKLLFPDATATGACESGMDIFIENQLVDKVNICGRVAGPRRAVEFSCPVILKVPGTVKVKLIATKGKACIVGAIITLLK